MHARCLALRFRRDILRMYVQAFADHAVMLKKRESKKSDITRADLRRQIFEKTTRLTQDYIKQRIGEIVQEQPQQQQQPAATADAASVELPELHRQYESDKSSESAAGNALNP